MPSVWRSTVYCKILPSSKNIWTEFISSNNKNGARTKIMAAAEHTLVVVNDLFSSHKLYDYSLIFYLPKLRSHTFIFPCFHRKAIGTFFFVFSTNVASASFLNVLVLDSIYEHYGILKFTATITLIRASMFPICWSEHHHHIQARITSTNSNTSHPSSSRPNEQP